MGWRADDRPSGPHPDRHRRWFLAHRANAMADGSIMTVVDQGTPWMMIALIGAGIAALGFALAWLERRFA